MTSADAKQSLARIEQIETTDVAGLLRVTYPEGEFSSITIGELSASNLIVMVARIVRSFKDAFASDGGLLPRYIQVGSGRMDVVKDLGHLLDYLQTKRWREAENTLVTFLVPYLMQAGYWTRAAEQDPAGNLSQSEQLLADAKEQLANLRTSISSLKKEEASLRERVINTRADLDSIKLATQDSLSSATKCKAAYTAIVADQKVLEHSKGRWEELTKSAELSKTTLERKTQEWEIASGTALLQNSESLAASANLYLKAKESHTWIEGKRSEIDKLTGRAADGSLGHSFNKRKSDLNTELGFWKLASMAASVAVVVYVFCAYMFIPAPSEPILAVVTHFGEVLPVLLVYGFVLRQYSRERSFLEEYEFKAAVALVVNAYADQLAPPKLHVDDFADAKALQEYRRAKDDERRKLISDTVAKLFTPPHIHTEKGPNVFTAFRPKAATDMLREAKKLVKEAKDF